jgi:predicted transposase YbfD/YdcC
MVPQCRPLRAVLAEIPDVRKARGKRHPLPAILALVCVAVLCGYGSYSAVAQWARIYPTDLVRALGFTHPTPPCAATLCTVLRQLDRTEVETKFGAWAEEVLASLPPAVGEAEAVALDGKSLRGSQRQGALQGHLLSALSHRLGLTVGQQAVDDKTNELTVIVPLLQSLVLDGRIFTMDALLTQRAVAQTIIDGGGDYVLIVKDNQPQPRADIELVFTDPPWDDAQPTAETLDSGHGRIEHRRLTASSALVGYCDWPGVQPVFQLERHTILKKTGELRGETVYGLTSLAPPRADPVRLLHVTRHHWRIENHAHYVRDVTFDEDRSQVRCGSTPEVMAAFRNTAIGLLRLAGATNIAAACRHCAAQPARALALIGIPQTTE